MGAFIFNQTRHRRERSSRPRSIDGRVLWLATICAHLLALVTVYKDTIARRRDRFIDIESTCWYGRALVASVVVDCKKTNNRLREEQRLWKVGVEWPSLSFAKAQKGDRYFILTPLEEINIGRSKKTSIRNTGHSRLVTECYWKTTSVVTTAISFSSMRWPTMRPTAVKNICRIPPSSIRAQLNRISW